MEVDYLATEVFSVADDSTDSCHELEAVDVCLITTAIEQLLRGGPPELSIGVSLQVVAPSDRGGSITEGVDVFSITTVLGKVPDRSLEHGLDQVEGEDPLPPA
jgi:hypothetical protein